MSTSAVRQSDTVPVSSLTVWQCVRTELINAEDQDGLVDLESQDLGLDKGKRLSVDLDETLSGLQLL